MKEEHLTDTPNPGWPSNNLLEAAWGIIANAGGGNWDKETSEWRDAAHRWRDAYHEHLDQLQAKKLTTADPQYDGSPGHPTFSERYMAVTIEQCLKERNGPGAEISLSEAENGKAGNVVTLTMADDEAHGLRITVEEVDNPHG